MSLTANLRLSLEGSYTNPQSEAGESGGTPGMSIAKSVLQSITNGTGANQADAYWQSEGRTLTSGNDEDIDLYDFGALDIGAGAGLDPLGQALTLADVVILLVVNRDTSTGTLLVGAEGSGAAWNSPFNGDDEAALALPPGGFALLGAPGATAFPVADTSNHLLTLAASGGDCTYDIYIIGRDS